MKTTSLWEETLYPNFIKNAELLKGKHSVKFSWKISSLKNENSDSILINSLRLSEISSVPNFHENIVLLKVKQCQILMKMSNLKCSEFATQLQILLRRISLPNFLWKNRIKNMERKTQCWFFMENVKILKGKLSLECWWKTSSY